MWGKTVLLRPLLGAWATPLAGDPMLTSADNRAILIVDHKLLNVSHAYRMEYLMPVAKPVRKGNSADVDVRFAPRQRTDSHSRRRQTQSWSHWSTSVRRAGERTKVAAPDLSSGGSCPRLSLSHSGDHSVSHSVIQALIHACLDTYWSGSWTPSCSWSSSPSGSWSWSWRCSWSWSWAPRAWWGHNSISAGDL